MRVLGLSGLAGSGKSTLAREFVYVHRAVPCSFATWFKVPACVAGDMPPPEVFGLEPKSPPVRDLLQRMGTEEGRVVRGEDWWVRHARADLFRLSTYGVPLVVYDDVRFQNEVDALREVGGLVVRLHREGMGLAGSAGAHPSEAGVMALRQVVDVNNDRPVDEVRRVIASLLWPPGTVDIL